MIQATSLQCEWMPLDELLAGVGKVDSVQDREHDEVKHADEPILYGHHRSPVLHNPRLARVSSKEWAKCWCCVDHDPKPITAFAVDGSWRLYCLRALTSVLALRGAQRGPCHRAIFDRVVTIAHFSQRAITELRCAALSGLPVFFFLFFLLEISTVGFLRQRSPCQCLNGPALNVPPQCWHSRFLYCWTPTCPLFHARSLSRQT